MINSKNGIRIEKKEFYEEMSFMKGFSIITIVLMHFMQNDELPAILLKAISIGGTGVHIFFFCSAFGLFCSYIKHPTGYIEFIKNRLTKIYVPYMMVVAVSSCLPFMFTGDRIKAFFSHMFLYKMFLPEYENTFGPFWYLSTLFQFYLIFIPLVRLKERLGKDKLFLIISVMISVCWWVITSYTGMANERVWGSFFLQYLWEFALGIVIAGLIQEGYVIKASRYLLLIIFVIGIGLGGMAKIVGGVLTTFNDPFVAFGYGAFALFLYSLKNKYIDRVVYVASSVSFELYLVHILVFESVKYLFNNWWISMTISIPLSIILAYAYHVSLKKVMK